MFGIIFVLTFSMEIWFQKNEQSFWEECDFHFIGIEKSVKTKVENLLIITNQPNIEIENIISLIAIIRKIELKKITIIVGTQNPSDELRNKLIRAGTDHIWLISEKTFQKSNKSNFTSKFEIPDQICPALNIKDTKNITLSVCGNHHNNLVLSINHLKKLCLSEYKSCPHYRNKDV